MKRNLVFKVALFLVLLFSASRSIAQETIINDIDYPFLQKLIANAKTYYPQLKIRQAQVDFSKLAYKSSKLSWFDNITTAYIYNPQNTINYANQNIFIGYQFAVSLNLGTLMKTPYAIKSAKQTYNISVLEQQAATSSLETQVTRLYYTYLQQLAILRLRTKTALDIENLLAQSKRQFEKGNETVENYTKAATTYADVSQAKIDTEVNLLIAKGALEEIIGKKLEEVK
jgi:outer membrane protein TolC